MTVTLTEEMADVVRNAVEAGEYASSSEVVREALRDWKMKRELYSQKFQQLKAEIDRGLADVRHGRLVPFQAKQIAARGRRRFAKNATSG
jgi:antitoxin ParD1/3/4